MCQNVDITQYNRHEIGLIVHIHKKYINVQKTVKFECTYECRLILFDTECACLTESENEQHVALLCLVVSK